MRNLTVFFFKRCVNLLTSFVVICLLLCASDIIAANEMQAKQTVVSLNIKDTKLEQVFKILEKQSDYEFIYNLNDLKRQRSVSGHFVDEKISIVIKSVLKNTDLCYEEKNNIIVIKKKKKENPDKKKITGKVTDASGNPLPGVTVLVKGTNSGVSTNINGEFSINIPIKKNIIVVSFIGMKSKEVNVKNKNNLNIILENDTQVLDEIVAVATGYGNIDKRKLSSSVSTVKGEKLNEGGAISVDNMLQGKISGLNVLNQTSTVGAAPKIRIRGASSISGSREPVWVVDGVILEDPVPISAEELNSLDNINLIGNAISSINPEDIKEISVLKDASATAIYGVKAANGVIVITTKKGKVGKTQIRYSTNITIDERPQYDNLNRMNSKERIDVSKEIERRGLEYGIEPAHIAYEGALFELFAGNISYNEFIHQVQRMESVNTDWYDILFRTAFSHKHTITVSGADEKTNYYFSGSFNDANGTFIDNNVRKYNGLLKVNTKINNKLNLNFQLRGYTETKNYQHSSIDPYSYAYNTSRAIPCFDKNGELSFYNRSQGYETLLKYNILNELNNTGRTIENQAFAFVGNLSWKINKSLKLNTLISYNRSNTYQKEWFNEESYYAADKRQLNYGEPFPTRDVFYNEKCLLPYGGGLSNNDTKNTSYTFRSTLRYNEKFNSVHEINSYIGTEIRSNQYDGISTRQYGYMPERGDKFAIIDPTKYIAYKNSLLELYPNVVTDRLTNVVSAFGTFTYTYNRKYIANFNIRVDGSNKFGQDKSSKYLPVWSISGRWNLHNEQIIKDVNWINQLALRASYGVQGNVSPEQGPDLIVKLGSRDAVSGEYVSTITKLPNPDLRWEKTTSSNIALDFAIFNGKLNGNVDIYKKVGTDQIISKKVSATTGRRSMSLNAGTIENRGFDLTLNINPINFDKFSWMISVNGGQNINEVIKSGITSHYTYSDYLNGRIVKAGNPLNGFYSYQFDKLNNKGLPTFKGVTQVEGDTKESMYAKAFVYSGKRVADIAGGFSSSFRYDNFSLNLLFSYSIGKKIRLNDLFKDFGQQLPNPQQNMSKEFVYRWKKEGDEKKTNIPRLSTNQLKMTESLFMNTNRGQKIEVANNGWQAYNDSDLRVVSGDFLRLRNVQFRYKIPKNICKRFYLKAANVKLEATNLWILKDSKLKGQDPEQVTFSFTKGSGAIPPTSRFTFGLDVTF